MAECIRFICSGCRKTLDAWSDGNPFYLDERGQKHYAYHPNHEELANCIANDIPHLCLDCGKEVKIDSRLKVPKCLKCQSNRVVECVALDGVPCPKCREGTFSRDDSFHAIS